GCVDVFLHRGLRGIAAGGIGDGELFDVVSQTVLHLPELLGRYAHHRECRGGVLPGVEVAGYSDTADREDERDDQGEDDSLVPHRDGDLTGGDGTDRV